MSVFGDGTDGGKSGDGGTSADEDGSDITSGRDGIISGSDSAAGGATCCCGKIEDKDGSGTGSGAEIGVVDGGSVFGGVVEVEEDIRCAYRNGHAFELIVWPCA